MARGATVHIVSKVPKAFFEESIKASARGAWVLHEVKTDVGTSRAIARRASHGAGAFQATSIDIDWCAVRLL